MAAQIEELTKAIEDKTVRLGNDGVLLVNLKEDLEDTTKSLAEDKKFLADLEKNCETKKKEWAERSKTRAEELLAIMDTIKILNDDDALELFEKALKGGKVTFEKVIAMIDDMVALLGKEQVDDE